MKTKITLLFLLIVLTAEAIHAGTPITYSPASCTLLPGGGKGPSCFGKCDATATVFPSGGIAPYTYSWSSSGGTAQTASNLCAGTYACFISDAVGCTLTALVTVVQPPPLQTTIDSVKNVVCHGESSGRIYSTTTGGTANYTYNWTPIGLPPTPDLVKLTAGTYTLHVTDVNGCTSSATAIVTQPAGLVPLPGLVMSTINLTCFGDSSGNAFLNTGALGGTPPYKYQWSNGATTAGVNNLQAGSYSAIVYDYNGCSSDSTFILTQPNLLQTTLDSVRNVGCHGESNGKIYTTTTGGTPNYTYNWTPILSPTDDHIKVAAGTYTLHLTDAHGCSSSVTAIIIEPDTIVPLIDNVLFTTSNVLCFGDSSGGGFVDSVLGGTPPYTYLWSNGVTTDTVLNLYAGLNSLIVYDDNGCSIDTTFNISQPTKLNLSLIVTDASCSGCNDGSIQATPSGGTPPYHYVWSPSGGATPIITGLATGTYTCCIIDSLGCITCESQAVSYPLALKETYSGDEFLTVFPNPAYSSSTVFIHLDIKSENFELMIYDIGGKQVQKIFVKEGRAEVRNLSPGIYLLRIEGVKKGFMKKLVVMSAPAGKD